jgi:TDG/mug DNA glycosylase family protein
MIKYQLAHDLDILFVVINPHPGSARRGVPFSNNKMFWYLLSDSSLIPESRQELQDDVAFKKMYETKFAKKYYLGLINLIDRPTRTTTMLKKTEADFGRERLRAAIKRYKPKIVCFVGKFTYALFAQNKTCSYGWQEPIDNSKVYVMHAPHHGPAVVRIRELQEQKTIALQILKKKKESL